jgi:hypothetical protein
MPSVRDSLRFNLIDVACKDWPSKVRKGMKREKPRKTRHSEDTAVLQGWKEIAAFLAQPVSTAQRWAKSGMPVRREGRYTVANREELSQWLGRESHMPAAAQIATNTADLSAGLKQSISAVRHNRGKSHGSRES